MKLVLKFIIVLKVMLVTSTTNTVTYKNLRPQLKKRVFFVFDILFIPRKVINVIRDSVIMWFI
jgi:hypothetical protein